MHEREEALEQAALGMNWRSPAFWASWVAPAALVVVALFLAGVDIVTDHTPPFHRELAAPVGPSAPGVQQPGAADLRHLPTLAPPGPRSLIAPWGDFGSSSFPGYNGGPPAGTDTNPSPYGSVLTAAIASANSSMPGATVQTGGANGQTGGASSATPSAPGVSSGQPAQPGNGAPSSSSLSGTPSGGAPGAPPGAPSGGSSGPSPMTTAAGGALASLGPLMPWPGYSPAPGLLNTATATLAAINSGNAGSSSSSQGSQQPSSTPAPHGHGSSRVSTPHAAAAPSTGNLTHHIGSHATLSSARRR